MKTITSTKQWRALAAHQRSMKRVHMRALFDADPKRFETFSLKTEDGLFIDYSKNRITDKTMKLLFALARARDVEATRDKMFSAQAINNSENRPVLHTALRAPANEPIFVSGQDIMPFIDGTLRRMEDFSEAVRNGAWKGYTGQNIKTVVNIGIGGSDLGPRMVVEALKSFGDGPRVIFVANVDGADISKTLENLDPHTTLFLIASKTFTTQETMANAHTARQWLLNAVRNEVAISRHFAALSVNVEAAGAFGINPDLVFPFGEWVGGRFSLWSAIGLSICMAIGFKNFRALLDGAHTMDKHFRTAPLEKNAPVILALLGLWYRNFWNAQGFAVLPYAQDLEHLTGWLQQLDMESNGKSVTRDDLPLRHDTAPVVFGQPGTNGQHAFHQMLHQGTGFVPSDFIGFIKPLSAIKGQHDLLLANMLAQSQALMRGRTIEEAGNKSYRAFSGNRPSNTILLDRLDPRHLGMLLALYEHKIFVQGVLWDINSFDQWGVELGKELAVNLLKNKDFDTLDSSTKGLLSLISQ